MRLEGSEPRQFTVTVHPGRGDQRVQIEERV